MGQEIAERQMDKGRRIVALIDTGHQVERVDVVYACQASRQIAAHPAHRQHGKALLLLKLRDQARVQQGALARTRLGVEEQQPLRQHPRQQVARLALAAEEEIALLVAERARADVGIGGGRGRGHGCPLPMSSWAYS